MSITVWLAARTLYHPKAGGHFWVYLNWALGLRALGCRVIWLESVATNTPVHKVQDMVSTLKSRLKPFDVVDSVALCSRNNEPLSAATVGACLNLEAITKADDLLLNMDYGIPSEVVGRFRRSALIDIDPGLTQIWMSEGKINIAPHDTYFTIGETVGSPESRFPDCGLEWHYTPPCVALNWWTPCQAAEDALFTTVSHWYEDEWVEDSTGWYRNDKLRGFLPFLDLPKHTSQPLELAINFYGDDVEKVSLQERGWRVREASGIANTPWDYQRYIQGSRGEFSCAKPSCVKLQNAWISDRTLCYLASGKPAVVQHTGPSRFLPDAAGLFRFHDVEEAACYLEDATADYERQCRLARTLVEKHFDAKKVIRRVLEKALA